MLRIVLVVCLFPLMVGAERTFTVLYANDFHGTHLPFTVTGPDATSQTGEGGFAFERQGEIGGLATMAGAVERIREARGRDSVILVHAGDALGDGMLLNLTRGEAMVQLMNQMGFDFMALGNHDFDYGFDRTRALQAMARFPMRGANVLERRTGQPALGEPILVREVGGVRVGLLALGYHHTNLTTAQKNVKGLRFVSGIDAARKWVPRLRTQADVVVVVSHQGSAVDEVLAREVPGIDVIVGGHSHDAMVRIGKTSLVQALSHTTMLGEATITVDDGAVEVQAVNHLLWTDKHRPDQAVADLIERLREPHQRKLTETIGKVQGSLNRRYMAPSPFDKWVGNILREHTGADIALLPGVGYGVNLHGPVTREALVGLLPHDAPLSVVRLTGAQILQTLEQSARNIEPEDPTDKVGGLIQTSGLTFDLDRQAPPGQRISAVRVDDEPLDSQRRYLVVTKKGMLDGMHRYDTIGQGEVVKRKGPKVADVVEEWLREHTPAR